MDTSYNNGDSNLNQADRNPNIDSNDVLVTIKTKLIQNINIYNKIFYTTYLNFSNKKYNNDKIEIKRGGNMF